MFSDPNMLIAMVFFILVTILILVSVWRLADWRNWRNYYPTILYFIVVDFMVNTLTQNHRLWLFQKTPLLPNHTLIDWSIAITNLAPITLLYLSRYPYKAQTIRQITYIAFWVVTFTFIESVFLLMKQISYQNGWNYWWSIVVWVFMFLGLRLHHTKPLWAWLFCIASTTFLTIFFKIPITQLK